MFNEFSGLDWSVFGGLNCVAYCVDVDVLLWPMTLVSPKDLLDNVVVIVFVEHGEEGPLEVDLERSFGNVCFWF